MPDTTRVLKITGDALKGMGGSTSKRTTRKASANDQRGGYDSPPPPAIPQPSPPSPASPPLPPLVSVSSPAGGSRKLHLAPKKELLRLVKKTPEVKVLVKDTPKNKTRKVIRIQMGHLRKSMKRASDITKSSKEKSIEEIEDLLIREKILRKRTSDRPMSDGRQQTLRGMYRDYVQLRSNLM